MATFHGGTAYTPRSLVRILVASPAPDLELPEDLEIAVMVFEDTDGRIPAHKHLCLEDRERSGGEITADNQTHQAIRHRSLIASHVAGHHHCTDVVRREVVQGVKSFVFEREL
jgi:hypothetical protein